MNNYKQLVILFFSNREYLSLNLHVCILYWLPEGLRVFLKSCLLLHILYSIGTTLSTGSGSILGAGASRALPGISIRRTAIVVAIVRTTYIWNYVSVLLYRWEPPGARKTLRKNPLVLAGIRTRAAWLAIWHSSHCATALLLIEFTLSNDFYYNFSLTQFNSNFNIFFIVYYFRPNVWTFSFPIPSASISFVSDSFLPFSFSVWRAALRSHMCMWLQRSGVKFVSRFLRILWKWPLAQRFNDVQSHLCKEFSVKVYHFLCPTLSFSCQTIINCGKLFHKLLP